MKKIKQRKGLELPFNRSGWASLRWHMAKLLEGAEWTAFQKYEKATVAWSREPEREQYEIGPGTSRGPITWDHGKEYAFNSKWWEAAAGLLPASCHDLIYMLKAWFWLLHWSWIVRRREWRQRAREKAIKAVQVKEGGHLVSGTKGQQLTPEGELCER